MRVCALHRLASTHQPSPTTENCHLAANRQGDTSMRKMHLRVVFSASLIGAAWAQQPALRVKGVVPVGVSPPDSKGAQTATVILKLYDRQFGGTLLFQE